MKIAPAHISLINRKRSFISILVVFLLCCPVSLFAYQIAVTPQQLHIDSLPKPHLQDTFAKKRFGRAAATLMLAETIPWAVDKYVRHMDWANISMQTLEYNLKPANWAWDDDGFTTNQFSHPYHGSLFFNAFRTNGYSFWQSSIATFAGSYIWETVAETQAPAPNDFINTGFGGTIFGEMTYKLANKITNNNSTGFKRQVNEVAAFIINPVNGFTRIIDGRWGKIAANSAERDSTKIYAEFDAGIRRFKTVDDGEFGLYGRVKFMYGNPLENYKIPFSNMLINAEFGKDDSSTVNIVSIYGSLNGWKIQAAKKNKHFASLTANYDYIRNNAFFYSGQSVKLHLYSGFELTRKLKLNTTIGGSLVVLAAVPDDYAYKGRYYDYCMGLGFNSGISLSIANHFFYNINYRGGWLKTVNGKAHHYFLHAITSEASFKINSKFSIVAETGYFTLNGNYQYHHDINKNYPYLRLSARYSVTLK